MDIGIGLNFNPSENDKRVILDLKNIYNEWLDNINNIKMETEYD